MMSGIWKAAVVVVALAAIGCSGAATGGGDTLTKLVQSSNLEYKELIAPN